MAINFNVLAGLNPQTQFISSTLDVVSKGCCGCLCCPSGEGSFDRLEVAKVLQTSITTRTEELQALNKETFDKLKGNVEAIAQKFSRIGAWFRSNKDLACEKALQPAIEVLAEIAAQRALPAASPRGNAGAVGKVFVAEDIGEAYGRQPTSGTPGTKGRTIHVAPAALPPPLSPPSAALVAIGLTS